MGEEDIVYSQDSDFFPLITKRIKRVLLYSFFWLLGAFSMLAVPLLILMMNGK